MGKGSSSSASTYIPVEQPDGLKSHQLLRIVDLIGEGELEGPVGGLKGVFLNDTAIENTDGSYNFSGVRAVWTNGTQNQSPLRGFPGVRNEIPVSVEVKYGKPVVRSVTDPNIDRLRVTVGVSALYQQQSNGDITGTRVDFFIQVYRDGNWVTSETVTINNKTRSKYLTSVLIDDLPATPFNFRVVRGTADSTSSKIANTTLFSSYTEIMDVRLSYPNTALAGIELDSSQFSGVPTRKYLVKGRRIKIPSNYDPQTRQYDGLWDGTFKISWTDNPAWIYYDIATCTRAGIGDRIGEPQIDKWALYQVAQYCDGLVDDGFGGSEPRMTCNVVLDSAEQAYQVFANLSGIFRGMPIWTGTLLSVSVDAPADPVYHYGNAQVKDGKFTYQSSSRKSRHTAAIVTYQSPDHDYEKQSEYVSDDDLIKTYGLNLSKITAFACTSRGQARRAGRWLLATEKLERHTVNFDVFREGLRHAPGDVIAISDTDYAGARLSGRVKAVDGKQVTLDSDVVIKVGETAFFSYLNASGKVAKISVAAHPNPDVVMLSSEPEGLAELMPWSLATQSLSPRLFRCVSVSESNGLFSITALEHVPEKQAVVEEGLQFEPVSDTLYSGIIPAIENLQVEATPEEASTQVRLTWDTPRVLAGLLFQIKLLRDGAVVSRKTVSDTEYRVSGARLGDYTALVRGTNAQGQLGPETTVSFTIGPPAEPVDIVFTPTNFSVSARPDIDGPVVIGTEYAWYYGTDEDDVKSKANYLGRGSRLDHQGLIPDTTYWYGVEAVNSVGRSAMLIKKTKTKLAPDDILSLIGPEIPKLDWMDALINEVKENTSGVVLLKDRAALVVNKDGRVSGMTVTAGDEASAIDLLASMVSFTNPETLKRDVYWDSSKKTLVIKGDVRLMDGTALQSAADLASSAGGIFRLETSTGVFPGDDDTASALFESTFSLPPSRDTVFTVYSTNSDGTVNAADSKMFDGEKWVVPKMFVDGDIIALGTIRGEHIVAGTQLRAPQVRGGNAGFGDGGPYNGYQTFIEDDGTLKTKKLVAKGGELDNVVIGSNATINGTVKASKVIGSKILKGSGSTTSTSGRIDTGFVASSWGDNTRTYVVELRTSGAVRANVDKTGSAVWAARVTVKPFIMTRWRGSATVHFEFSCFFSDCWADPGFTVSWKLWELI